MKVNKILISCLVLFMICSCSNSTNGSSEVVTSSLISDSTNPNSSSSGKIIPVAKNKETFRISDIYDCFDDDNKATYKVYLPYDDEYTLSCNSVSKINIYDEEGNLISSGSTSVCFIGVSDAVIYIELIANSNSLVTPW